MSQAPPLEELMEELMPVGRLVAAQGLRGELRLLPLMRCTKPL